MDDIYREYKIVQLDEEDVSRISHYIMEKPFLWCPHMFKITIAVTYNEYKFCCTGYSVIDIPIIILTPEKILHAKYSKKKRRITKSTGDIFLDNIVSEISEFFFPIDEPEIAWLIDTFFNIHECEYTDPYENARCGILTYESEMVRKYLDIDYLEKHQYDDLKK